MPRAVSPPAETALYPAVKAFLEGQGYDVKAEVRGCDVVAILGDEPPVIVELKLSFGLALVLQGVDRLALTDRVYLAVIRPRGRRARRAPVQRRDVRDLCRRLGLGLLTVEPGRGAAGVEVIVDPTPYRPRRRAASLTRPLREPQGAARDRSRAQRVEHPAARRLRLVPAARARHLRPDRARTPGPRALRGAQRVARRRRRCDDSILRDMPMTTWKPRKTVGQ